MDLPNEWYSVENIDTLDSPALLLYAERIQENIRLVKKMVKDVDMLRPHVKTHKISEVCSMMMKEGILKFKCATIAEAEMLALIKAPDVLLAYQPVGPKIKRLIQLIKAYPGTTFSCLADNTENTVLLSRAAQENKITINIFIDLNVGMNRTGISPDDALPFIESILSLKEVKIIGLHAYDGHIIDSDIKRRQQKSNAVYDQVFSLCQKVESACKLHVKIVIGGSPTFPNHASREGAECSPGTFVLWDWGYGHRYPDEPFQYAALVITRVISIIDGCNICTDLGSKSVASEGALPRVHFLNAPDAVPVSQSEEHLVITVPSSGNYHIGDVLYGVPVHICPTVASYGIANVVDAGKLSAQWKVIARNRVINY